MYIKQQLKSFERVATGYATEASLTMKVMRKLLMEKQTSRRLKPEEGLIKGLIFIRD